MEPQLANASCWGGSTWRGGPWESGEKGLERQERDLE